MWLIRSDEETNPEYGKRPVERTIEEQIKNSIIIIDKHSGPTSQQFDEWIKQIFGVKKVGHSGTLDPMVTGVLLIAMENATKSMSVLMGLDKVYVGVMHVHKDVDEKVLRDTVTKFIGKIKQLPPVKSAVARRVREREVYFFDILEINDKDVLFRVGCQAGTYIRKLCHDIGVKLGVGAHMSELRRTHVGNFTEGQSHNMLAINDAYEEWKNGNEKPLRKILIPVEHAVIHLKKVFVSDAAIGSICHGSPLYVTGVMRVQKGIEVGDVVAVYSLKEELVAFGVAEMNSDGMFSARKGTAVKTDRVFMDKDVYPKM